MGIGAAFVTIALRGRSVDPTWIPGPVVGSEEDICQIGDPTVIAAPQHHGAGLAIGMRAVTIGFAQGDPRVVIDIAHHVPALHRAAAQAMFTSHGIDHHTGALGLGTPRGHVDAAEGAAQ